MISVVIPVYNVEPYLARCLDSIVNNTYSTLEIICVNDGSNDGSLRILRDYEGRDNRIRVVDKPNGGLTSARNAGVDLSTGEFIAFVDSDDWVHYRYFETLIEIWEKTDRTADIVMCGYMKTSGMVSDEIIEAPAAQIHFGSWDVVRQIKEFRVHVWAKLYRRELIGEFRQPIGINLGEDVLFNLMLLGRRNDTRVAASVEYPLYYYYCRESSIVHTTKYSDMKPAILWLADEVMSLSPAKGRTFACEVLLKHTLALRYAEMFHDRANPKARTDYRPMLRKELALIKREGDLSRKQLLVCEVFCSIPPLYRLFRILHDPSLLKWETEEKKLYASTGKHA